MTLADYLELRGQTPSAFARQLKVSHAAVLRWLSGQRTPEPDSMRAIIAATNGAVQPNDFFGLGGGARRIDPKDAA